MHACLILSFFKHTTLEHQTSLFQFVVAPAALRTHAHHGMPWRRVVSSRGRAQNHSFILSWRYALKYRTKKDTHGSDRNEIDQAQQSRFVFAFQLESKAKHNKQQFYSNYFILFNSTLIYIYNIYTMLYVINYTWQNESIIQKRVWWFSTITASELKRRK